MVKKTKDKAIPKGETPFGRFEQLAKKVVTAPKENPPKSTPQPTSPPSAP